MALQTFDVTSRKAHQWTMVVLIVVGFLLGAPRGAIALVLAGAIMLIGRFWWPADVVRQLTWRVLEPAGILKRDDVQEDHETRRDARIIGGAPWLRAAPPPAVIPGPARAGPIPNSPWAGPDANPNTCAP